MRPRHSQSLWTVFRWPLLIGLLSIIGLISALVGDGFLDLVSWASLAVPVVISFYKLRDRHSASTKETVTAS